MRLHKVLVECSVRCLVGPGVRARLDCRCGYTCLHRQGCDSLSCERVWLGRGLFLTGRASLPSWLGQIEVVCERPKPFPGFGVSVNASLVEEVSRSQHSQQQRSCSSSSFSSFGSTLLGALYRWEDESEQSLQDGWKYSTNRRKISDRHHVCSHG